MQADSPGGSNSLSQGTQLLPQLLDRLVCPVCHGALRLEGPNTIRDAGLATILCTACGRRYPILDGIPVLIPDSRVEEQPGRRQGS